MFDSFQDCASADTNLTHVGSNQIKDLESAPAPTRFVRKQVKGKAAEHHKNAFLAAKHSATLIGLEDDIWAFDSGTNQRDVDQKYYVAHRQYVAQEIASSIISPAMDARHENWGRLRDIVSNL